MSFNLLKNVDIERFSKLEGKPLVIQEKLDTVSFWLHISENNVQIVDRGKCKYLNEVDYFLNSLYHEVEDLIYRYINESKREKFIEKYGEFDIQVFYFPASTIYHTFYPNYLNEEYIVISDIWISNFNTFNGNKFELLEKVANEIFGGTRTTTLDIIKCDEIFINLLKKYKADEISDLEFAKGITDEAKTMNMLMNSTYGLLIRTNTNIWQIPILNYERIPYDDIHSQYRDIILHDFVNELCENSEYAISIKQIYEANKAKTYNNNLAYINAMAFAFLCYINKTDVFKKYYIEPNDILPVHYGFVPNVSFDMLDDITVQTICKHNLLMQAVLKLLVHTFFNINSNTFKIFNELETRAISNLISAISE